ncbi:PIN domain-containing protein [Herbaspirillum huttiense]|uniref:PIN domain-containing protein n=1 Tax=Herbaspirillum huttiense subsp. lycopersici TaxID=3074428 RepID=A0ABU2EFY3_9BURK|nr:PIN domain-containing protein [Herbaspirillum huttiense]MDR9847044.1 PIN domain-containing protein [Herbaspirillum huttiense SE1]
MTSGKHLLDSNILIDYLKGIQAAADLIEALPKPVLISAITRTEILSGARSFAEELELIAFLRGFETVGLDDDIIVMAARVRRGAAGLTKKPKLPDAIIYATSLQRDAILYTRNSKDFPAGERVIHPYIVSGSAPSGAGSDTNPGGSLLGSNLTPGQMAMMSTENIGKISSTEEPESGPLLQRILSRAERSIMTDAEIAEASKPIRVKRPRGGSDQGP